MDKCSGTGQIRRFCALPFRRKLPPCERSHSSGAHATAAGRTSPAYLVESEATAGRRSRGTRPARAVEELANGLLALGVRKGDAFGILAQTSLEWALFDYALARDRCRRGGDLREQLAEGLPLRARALGRGRRAGRGRGAAGEDRGRLPRPRAHLRRSRRAARPRPGVRRRQSGGTRRGRGTDRRGGHLHLHLHLGHDRAAEGLHDPPPQLLRDGDGASTTSRSSPSPTT